MLAEAFMIILIRIRHESFRVTAVSESTRISIFSGLLSCIINSRQAPHGGKISPIFVTATTFLAAYSP